MFDAFLCLKLHFDKLRNALCLYIGPEILKDLGWVGMEWIHLPLNRDQWRALVNTVMNLRGTPKSYGNS
jgi:hypothetical protein